MGAGNGQLSMQLFADTFMTVGFGFLIAQLIQFDLLGIMNRIMSIQVPVNFLYSSQMLPVTFGFILLLACIPALYMSRRLPEMSVSMYNNFYRGNGIIFIRGNTLNMRACMTKCWVIIRNFSNCLTC